MPDHDGIQDEDFRRIAETVLLSAAEAIIYSDRAGMIRYWNAGAERLFGFSAIEAVGRSLDIIIPERQRERHWQGYRQVVETGRSRYGEGQLLAVPALRKDGMRISIEFTIVPVTGRDDRLVGMAAVVRDATSRFNELKELRKRLAAQEGGE
ncbi:MAG TPA: PAS domain S-box protein [Arenibaculum sp.]|nr:PAS domain S-box protein [Arenibaculum sp.]